MVAGLLSEWNNFALWPKNNDCHLILKYEFVLYEVMWRERRGKCAMSTGVGSYSNVSFILIWWYEFLEMFQILCVLSEVMWGDSEHGKSAISTGVWDFGIRLNCICCVLSLVSPTLLCIPFHKVIWSMTVVSYVANILIWDRILCRREVILGFAVYQEIRIVYFSWRLQNRFQLEI